MYQNELDLMAHQERYKELLQETEHERLIRTARLHNSGSRKLNLRLTNWLGARLVSWGMNLQQSDPAVAPACCNSCC